MNEDEVKLYERAVIAIEKLSHEVPRLRRDVQTLVNRIEPFEGDRVIPDVGQPKPKPVNFREVLDRFEDARKDIRNAEHSLQIMSARLDQIHNDSWSREDIKPWLKR